MFSRSHLQGSANVGEFGNKFRKARESKELSLEDVAQVTKISARMLRAIEEEDFDRLPGGVFNKGFIRAYAKHLGLDSEEAVSEYFDCLRQAQVDSHQDWDSATPVDPRASARGSATAKSAGKAQASVPVGEELPHLQLPRAEHVRPARKEYLGRSSSEIPWSLIYLVAIIVVAAALLWIRHSRSVHNVAARSAVATSNPVPASTLPAPSPSSAASIASPHPPAPATPSPAAAHAKTLATSNPASPPSNQIKASSQIKDTNQIKLEKKDVEKKEDSSVRSLGASTPKPAASSTANLTLVIRASENSWISVTSDGQPVTHETLIAPAAISFHAARELVVRVGNAAGVSFLWNGEEILPQGAEAEAKTLIFNAQGMSIAPPTQAPPQN